ncbi:MAG: Lacal_2735 family protein [Saprospiraceae bacterium]|nr:Lacal_2735 family protein [Saprospiraceae bacterium]
MFGLFKKDKVKELQKHYQKLMEEAMHIQRNGDIKGYALKVAEAEEIMKKIEEIQQQKA